MKKAKQNGNANETLTSINEATSNPGLEAGQGTRLDVPWLWWESC